MMTMSGSLINFDQFKDTPETKTKALMNAYQGGANSGFEIDGMEFFKNDSLSKEFPEMKDEIELIVSTESYLAKLADFRHRVIENKGMSRGMSHELLELLPSLESFTNPRHFTEEISGVGVEFSLEAIDFKLWGLIAAGVAFVIGLIYKFITWYQGGSGGSGGGGGSASVSDSADEGRAKVEAIEESMEGTGEAAADAEKAMNHAPTGAFEIELPAVVDHDKVERSHLPDTLKDLVVEATSPLGTSPPPEEPKTVAAEYHILQILDSLEDGHTVSEAVRNPSRYAKIIYGERSRNLEMLLASFDNFSHVAGTTLLKLDVLGDMAKTLEKMKPEDELGTTIKFRLAIENMNANPVAGGFKVGGTHFETVQEWAHALKEFIADDHKPIEFVRLSDVLGMFNIGHARLSKVDWHTVAVLFDLIEKAEPILKKTEEVVEQIGKGGENGRFKVSGELAEMVLIPLRSCQKDIMGLMSVYADIIQVYSEVMKNGAAVVNLLRHNAHGIKKLYEDYGQEVPKPVEELVKEVTEIAERYFEWMKANRSVSTADRGVPSPDDDD